MICILARLNSEFLAYVVGGTDDSIISVIAKYKNRIVYDLEKIAVKRGDDDLTVGLSAKRIACNNVVCLANGDLGVSDAKTVERTVYVGER